MTTKRAAWLFIIALTVIRLTMLAAKDGRVILGVANVGGLATLSSGFASEGTFTSPVLDAGQISRFGKVHLQGSLPTGTTP